MITVGSYEYSNQDAKNTIALSALLLDAVNDGFDPTLGEGAAKDLADHLAEALGVTYEGDPAAALHDLATQAGKAFGTTGWEAKRCDRHVGQVMRAVSRSMAAIRATGALACGETGTVMQLSSSKGGVPKHARESIEVSFSGVRGDVQSSRQHHGRPWQALCLWSREVIDAFVADGHNLAPGFAGENITVEGIPWDRVRPGTRLRMGTVLTEVWAYAVPCRHQAQWFTDGDYSRLHHSNGPVSRVYGLVLETGSINAADTVTFE